MGKLTFYERKELAYSLIIKLLVDNVPTNRIVHQIKLKTGLPEKYTITEIEKIKELADDTKKELDKDKNVSEV